MLELSIPDMHFGKMALVEETGNNYNLEIAEQLFTAAITSLVEAALADGTNPELLVLPIGNDMFHVDNAYLTTFNRTPVDALHSVKQLFRRVKNLLRRTIINLNTISPVEIIQVPGNHDKTISYFLSEALEDMFWNSSSINVRTTAMNRQYFAWRTVLLGYAHGDKPKRDRLPYLMAHEAPQLYAESKFREWHLGHTHTEQEEKYFPISTNEGMVCRTLPSLSAADAWHHDHGFNTAPRTAQALLWDEQIGLAATYYARLVPD